MFDSPAKLLLGLLTGFLFGFLLQKGRAAKFEVIVGQLLLKDWTVAKIMGSAIAVGGAGVYALHTVGLVSLTIKPVLYAGVIIGGVIFSLGLALLGYCPGTTVAACGEGHRDAFAGLAGMLIGAFAYVWLYRAAATLAKWWGDAGQMTLPNLTGIPAWVWLTLVTAIVLGAGPIARWATRRPAQV